VRRSFLQFSVFNGSILFATFRTRSSRRTPHACQCTPRPVRWHEQRPSHSRRVRRCKSCPLVRRVVPTFRSQRRNHSYAGHHSIQGPVSEHFSSPVAVQDQNAVHRSNVPQHSTGYVTDLGVHPEQVIYGQPYEGGRNTAHVSQPFASLFHPVDVMHLQQPPVHIRQSYPAVPNNGMRFANEGPYHYPSTDSSGSGDPHHPDPSGLPDPSRTWKCSIEGCNQVCKTRTDLLRHLQSSKHAPAAYPCPGCDVSTHRQDSLKRHIALRPHCKQASRLSG
jgi:hypothetical protein